MTADDQIGKKAQSGRAKEKAGPARLVHPFPPLYDPDSRVLILGTFPSVKSREQAFYYGHPQNRFWAVLAALYSEDKPDGVPEKKAFILRRHLALWDVIAECRIAGSSDASIRDARPNDLRMILDRCPIGLICCNGKTAKALYDRHIAPAVHREALCLPSTSPANASWSLERLIGAWGVIKRYT